MIVYLALVWSSAFQEAEFNLALPSSHFIVFAIQSPDSLKIRVTLGPGLILVVCGHEMVISGNEVYFLLTWYLDPPLLADVGARQHLRKLSVNSRIREWCPYICLVFKHLLIGI